jgi:hypothetical protein
MAVWLKQCAIRTIALQSTGVYWIAVDDILEEAGFEVYLVNAKETKNLPGRKGSPTQSWDSVERSLRIGRPCPVTGCDGGLTTTIRDSW